MKMIECSFENALNSEGAHFVVETIETVVLIWLHVLAVWWSWIYPNDGWTRAPQHARCTQHALVFKTSVRNGIAAPIFKNIMPWVGYYRWKSTNVLSLLLIPYVIYIPKWFSVIEIFHCVRGWGKIEQLY